MTLHDAYNAASVGDPYSQVWIWRFESTLDPANFYIRLIEPCTCKRGTFYAVSRQLRDEAQRTQQIDGMLHELLTSETYQTQSDFSNWEVGSRDLLLHRVAERAGRSKT